MSTTTNITSLPFDFGRPSTKSMLISDHLALGIGSGSSKPGYWVFSVFQIWQTGQSAI
jgi:hypothetical protein